MKSANGASKPWEVFRMGSDRKFIIRCYEMSVFLEVIAGLIGQGVLFDADTNDFTVRGY